MLPESEARTFTLTLLVGLASGVICLAVTRGGLFEPFRARLSGKLATLFSCPLCLGAYVVAGLWAFQGLPDGLSAPVAWGAAWAVSTGVAFTLEHLYE